MRAAVIGVVLAAALACAAPANAAPTRNPICAQLDEWQSTEGIAFTAGVLIGGGLDPQSAGAVVAAAVHSGCPEYQPLIDQFSNEHGKGMKV